MDSALESSLKQDPDLYVCMPLSSGAYIACVIKSITLEMWATLCVFVPVQIHKGSNYVHEYNCKYA